MTDRAAVGLPAPFDAILGLGSNIGDKVSNIERAVDLVCRGGDVRLCRLSRYFKTPPWGVTDQDWFVNACAAVATELDPHALLERCLKVEIEMGRVRAVRWGPRIVDVDVLVHRSGPVSDAKIELPHPRIAERAFVLAPLADLAPDLVIAGRPVKLWLDMVDMTGVEVIEPAAR